VVKAISWRVLATIITTALAFSLTGNGEFAAAIGAADTLLKFFVYFGHERLWNRIPYGRVEEKQPEFII